MAEVGALVVDAKVNSATFVEGVKGMRGELGKLGEGAKSSEHALAGFAVKGLEAVIPGAEAAGGAIHRFLGKALAARGGLLLLGQAGLVIGGAFAVAKITEAAVHYAKFGETIGQLTERLKKAQEEEQKFLENLKKVGDLQRSLAKSIDEGKGQLEVTTRKGAGDEAGAAAADLESKLKSINALEDEGRRKIFDTTKDGAARAKLLAQNEEQAYVQRKLARENYDQAIVAALQKEQAEHAKTWIEETGDLIKQLKTRQEARQQFEATLGSGQQGLGNDASAAAGVKAANDLEASLKKSAQEAAFLKREGIFNETDLVNTKLQVRDDALKKAAELRATYAAYPPVLDRIDKALGSIDFGTFGQEVAQGKTFIDQFIGSAKDAPAQIKALEDRLKALPAGVNQASPEIRQLTQDFVELVRWAQAAAGSIDAVNSRLADQGASGAAPASTPSSGQSNTGAQVFQDAG